MITEDMNNVTTFEHKGSTFHVFSDDDRTNYTLKVNHTDKTYSETINQRYYISSSKPHQDMIRYYGLESYKDVTGQEWLNRKRA